ncbi:hypothetical protein BKA01_006979 [Pseudonocardia eucalypti]|uniref:hypothetical protein n=1 Tax=Pseudonocardia eucalypti TaxID=648755 RepID=UPI0016196F22|nr:hypothetical protein [Pseudonocardia eucalypti]
MSAAVVVARLLDRPGLRHLTELAHAIQTGSGNAQSRGPGGSGLPVPGVHPSGAPG